MHCNHGLILEYQDAADARVHARHALREDVLGVLTTFAVWGAVAGVALFLSVGVAAWVLLLGVVV